ncbi:TRAP transporter large permease subunit [Alcaligenaceae bacterium CGII-47]|nr:TRAP transporter large permease subunit [Alcaligenaceae bacterium CGII-47]
MTTILSISLLFTLLALGTPVGFAMAIVGALGLYMLVGLEAMIGVLSTTPFSSVSSYEMVTVPMFLLMAEFVILSGVADSLFRAAATWVGRLKGGLAMATALAGAGFGAIAGSSTASAATLTATTIPLMLKQGYEPRLACGVVAISGTLAMLIPPSIALILYGLIANVDIGQLLIAGVIPGILVMLTIISTIAILVRLYPDAAPSGRQYTWREKISVLRTVGPMLFLFSTVTGVIYSGIATPTEASAIGAFGAFVLVWKMGKLSLISLRRCLIRAAETSCMVFMIILGAQIFGYFIAMTNLTQDMVAWIHALDLSRWLVIFLVLLLLLILGCFMDQIAILFLTVPVLVPLVVAYGFDPLWFGVIMIVTAELGMVTPPIGMNAFVISRYSGRPLTEIFRGALPHILTHLIIMAVLVAVPQLVTWLPSTMR